MEGNWMKTLKWRVLPIKLDLKESMVTRVTPAMISPVGALSWETRPTTLPHIDAVRLSRARRE
jgi:hypothetical protein